MSALFLYKTAKYLARPTQLICQCRGFRILSSSAPPPPRFFCICFHYVFFQLNSGFFPGFVAYIPPWASINNEASSGLDVGLCVEPGFARTATTWQLFGQRASLPSDSFVFVFFFFQDTQERAKRGMMLSFCCKLSRNSEF